MPLLKKPFLRSHPRWRYLLLWSAAFGLVALVGYAPFWLQGRSFLWSADGRTQFYPFILYVGQWLRDALSGLLSGHPAFPMFDFSLGMGEDITSIFGFLGLFDPLMLFTIFVRQGLSAEIFYTLLVLVRAWLAGLSFAWFCRLRGCNTAGALAGSVLYVFCGFSLVMANQYPSFLIPLIYLPLLLGGFDRILQGGKPWLFLAAAFYAAITGFYFLFICSVALAVYGVLRGLSLHLHALPLLIGRCLRSVFWYCVALGLSAPLFLPMVRGYLNCSRSGSGYIAGSLWHVTLDQAHNLLLGLFAGPFGFDGVGLCALAGLALAALLLCRVPGGVSLRVASLLGLVGLCVPAFGWAMNGMGYVSWRWTFLLSFLFSFLVAFVWPQLCAAPRRLAVVAALASLLYFWQAAACASIYYLLTGVAFLLLAGVLVFVRCADKKQLTAPLLCLCAVLTAAVNLLSQNASWGGNYAAEFLYYNEWNSRQETPYALFETLQNDTGFYRIQQPESAKNASWTEGWHGTGIYISILNRYYADTLLRWEVNPDINTNYDFAALDERSALDTLCCVKYMIVSEGGGVPIPAGYSLVESQTFHGQNWLLYQNRNALPLAYSYAVQIEPAALAGTNGLEQQQSALHGVLLAETESALPTVPAVTGLSYLEPTLTLENAEYTGSAFQAGTGATVTLQAQMPADGELYLRLADFVPSEYIANITASCGGITKKATYFNKAHPEYFSTPGCTFSFGPQPAGPVTVTIQFDPGYYTLGGFALYAASVEDLDMSAEQLAQESLTDVQLSANRVEGQISLADTRQVVFSIPYSSGWRLTVDGTPLAMTPANGIFLSAAIGPGQHTLVLTYRSPGLKTGLALFALTLCLLAGRAGALALYRRKHAP